MYSCLQIGLMYVKDIKEPSGFITFQDIRNKIGNSPSQILEYNVIISLTSLFKLSQG